MSFDNAIERYSKRKDRRQRYYGSKRFDRSCRNHGSCGWCQRNRRFSTWRRREAAEATREESAFYWHEAWRDEYDGWDVDGKDIDGLVYPVRPYAEEENYEYYLGLSDRFDDDPWYVDFDFDYDPIDEVFLDERP